MIYKLKPDKQIDAFPLCTVWFVASCRSHDLCNMQRKCTQGVQKGSSRA